MCLTATSFFPIILSRKLENFALHQFDLGTSTHHTGIPTVHTTMADYTSIAATGRSLVRFLNHCFTEENPHPLGNTTTAVLIRSEDFKPSSEQGSAPAIRIRPCRSSSIESSVTEQLGRVGPQRVIMKEEPIFPWICTS